MSHEHTGHALTRRGFLGTVGTAAALTPLAGSAMGRTQPESAAPIQLGTGEFRFECIHDWLVPPAGYACGDTHGLTQDAKGNIYVAHTVHGSSKSPDAVLVFNRKGEFQRSWGAEFRGGAHGLDIRDEGGTEFLYHCDTRRRRVVKTTLDGEVVWERGMPKEAGVYASENRYCPTNVAFHPDGDLYVGDGYGSSYIHRYTKDGDYVATIGSPGNGEGQMACPHGLWIDSRDGTPKLLVADRSNRRLQYFTLDGEHLGFVTEGMRHPCHFKIRGDYVLIPDLHSVILVLDKQNKVVASLGDGHPTQLRGAPREKFVPGQFVHPHDAIWLDNGDILVAEWVPIGRVTLLKRMA